MTTGWRVWGLRRDELGPVLRSPEIGKVNLVTLPIPMTYGEQTAWAACIDGHRPPKVKCSCGIYSSHSYEAAASWLPPGSVAVAGRVELLGKVVQGAPGTSNEYIAGLMPLVGAATGLDTGPEYRSTGVRLKGKQRVHPDHADDIPALEARYGVRFRVDPELRNTVDASDALYAAAQRIRAQTFGGDSAGLALFNRERTHVVLQLRSQYVDHPGTWAFVGGCIEPGESPTDAALREAWEEARLSDVTVTGTVRRKGYTYVAATADWTPDQDWVVPHSAGPEAEGAGWLPVEVLDNPHLFPRYPLHPKLAKAWPRIREQLCG